MEGHINARKRDSSKATLKDDVTFGFMDCLSLRERFRNNIPEHLLDLVNAERRGELLTELVRNMHG
jgi:hypothetical protein